MTHAATAPAEHWYALWTRSHSERLVHDQLAARGFELFFPTVKSWSRRRGTKTVINLPMFPGYLFLRHAMDRQAHGDIRQARGLVRILGEAWDRLTPVPDSDIGGLQRLLQADAAVRPWPFLADGQRVRVARGPMTGVEGVLVRTQPGKGRLVISVGLLKQSVSVVVDCMDVTAL